MLEFISLKLVGCIGLLLDWSSVSPSTDSRYGEAGDGLYGAMIPYQSLDDKIKYYVRAQNDDAMILEPRRVPHYMVWVSHK